MALDVAPVEVEVVTLDAALTEAKVVALGVVPMDRGRASSSCYNEHST